MKKFVWCALLLALVGTGAASAQAPELCPAVPTEEAAASSLPELLDGSGITRLASGACSVTRYCDYPPPQMVTCTSQSGDCILGTQSVTCDGEIYSCSPCPTPTCSPDCDDVNGTFCKSGTTSCQMAINCSCRTFSCSCWNNTWACP